MIIMILAAIAAIFSVVLIHELGHFIVARLCGVKVIKFSIGFGKVVCSYTSKKTGTQYALSLIPLGGYVKMYGEQPDQPITHDELQMQAYSNKPVWQRMAIALAGPAANIVLAIVLFFIVHLLGVTYIKPIVGGVVPNSVAAKSGIVQGEQIIKINQHEVYGWQQVMTQLLGHIGEAQPVSVTTQKNGMVQQHQLDLSQWALKERGADIIQSLGFKYQFLTIPPIVERVEAKSSAAVAGIKVGDLILKMDNQSIQDWSQLLHYVRERPGKTVPITVRRKGADIRLMLPIATEISNGKAYGHMGVQVKWPRVPDQFLHTVQYGFIGSIKESVSYTWNLLVLNLKIIGKMFTGSVSVNTLGGPISVFKTAGQASEAGLSVYLSFIGFVSVALGFINLLPIPMLDGGHVLFQLIEVVTGKPVSLRYQILGLKIGVIVIAWLMVQATVNDVLRLIQ